MKHRCGQVQSALAALCLALATGCSSDSLLAPNGSLTVYKIEGDRQIGIAGQALSRELRIQVWDARARVFDVAVSFEVTGGGSVEPGTTRTDRAGNALTRWTLGGAGGENALTVKVAGAEPQTFVATAVAVESDSLYYYKDDSGREFVIGLIDTGHFIALDPFGCSAEGLYEISGSTITFSMLSESGEPHGCLPALTGSMDEDAIVFEWNEYDEWTDDVYTITRIYRKNTS